MKRVASSCHIFPNVFAVVLVTVVVPILVTLILVTLILLAVCVTAWARRAGSTSGRVMPARSG